MINHLLKLDRRALAVAKEIGGLAQDKGLGAYLVGGPVRDLLLRRKILDLDFVIEGDAMKLADEYAHRHKAQCVHYPAFKTATVFLSNGAVIDFVSSRREIYAYPGALPTVTLAGIADDLLRRDFTVNAIAISVTPSSFGVVVDPYGGLNDIKQKHIRLLHPRSFMDDPTRLLRAVRFETRLGFRMDKESLRLFKEALAHKAISFVKPQRYMEEFKRLLNEQQVHAPLARLRQLQALKLPPLELVYNERRVLLIKEVEKSLKFCQRKGVCGVEAWIIRLMSIIDEEKPDALYFVLGQLGMSKSDKDKMASSLEFPKVLGRLSSDHIKVSWVYGFLKGYATDVLVFFRCLANEEARRRIDRFLTHDRHVKLAIDGDDLKKMGVAAGVKMRYILEEVLRLVLEGKLKRKEQQLQYAKELGEKHGAH